MEDRDDDFLSKSEGDKVRPRGKKVGPRLRGHGNGGGERPWRMDGIGVRKEEPIAGGGLGELMTSPVLAGPAFRQRRTGNEAVPGAACHQVVYDFRGAVGRAVIEDEYFEVRVLLSNERRNAGGDGTLFIAGGDENGDTLGRRDEPSSRSERLEKE